MNDRTSAATFLGTGWSFPPEFNRRFKDVKMVSEEEDIQESLRILLSTTPGERIMHPSYGCGLKSLVFEHIDESAVTAITDLVERAILFFEPRVTVEQVRVDITGAANGVLMIHLAYTIRATNSRSNMVYPFYRLEGTNVRQ